MSSRQKFTKRFHPTISTSLSLSALLVTSIALVTAHDTRRIRFVLLGDRTGEEIPGVYQAVWRAVFAEHPDFVVNVGDSIQGGNDRQISSEWLQLLTLLKPLQKSSLYFVPGNHDVWSSLSSAAYIKYTGHSLHYSFDYRQVHFTVLDNSKTEDLPASELAYLEDDLKRHSSQPVKFVLFHRPSWVLKVLLRDPNFPLHRLAQRYGVQYVVTGHVHQMLRFELDGINYLSMPSAGGHLRNPKTYEKGWFFGQTLVTVNDKSVSMEVHELGSPYGQERTSTPQNWGAAGLLQ